MLRCFLLLLLLTPLAVAPASVHADEADLILHHGKIVTVDSEFRIAEAIAIEGDRILAVGTNEEIRKLAGPKTEQVDLGGKMVIPGLMDSHVHPTGASLYEFDHIIPEMANISDLLAYIRGRAAALEEGAPIRIRQVFITRLEDQRYPTRQELDEAAPRNPVVFSTGPDAMLNSLALEASGIGKGYKVTDGGTGYVELDPKTGEPTGMLRSCGRLIKVGNSGKSPTAQERYDRLKEMLAHYNAVGLTTIADRGASSSAIDLYHQLFKNGELTCRTFLNYSISPGGEWSKVEEQIKRAAEHPLRKPDNMLWIGAIKMFLDGGMLTGSAYMRQPWGVSRIYSITDPDYQGLLYIEHERLVDIVRCAMQHGLQPTAHSVGDGAVHALINAYAEVNREFPVRKHRPCITHCNFMSLEAIEKMKELGIVADLQPAWLHLDGRTLTNQFGEERLTYFQPYKSLFDYGVKVGGGSDHMQKMGDMRSVNPYNPFYGMWITLARQPRWSDKPLHPEQRITREQALRLYTIDNAYILFAEEEKGSLEKGKLADFVILDRDLLTCPLDEVAQIKPVRTYLGGKVVYDAAARSN